MKKIRKKPLIKNTERKLFPINYQLTKVIYYDKDAHISSAKGISVKSIQNSNTLVYYFYKNICNYEL